jgi:calcineurin-like phosphoesterase family protein
MTGGAVYFLSDPHLGHPRVSEIRGFSTTDEHDATVAQNWYDTILPKDQVWVLGDLCVAKPDYALSLISQLPGTKHLIAGNHDACHPMHRNAHKYLPQYLEVFVSVQAFARRRIMGHDVLLSHFPYSRDRGEARYTQYRLRNEGKWLIHGHTHGTEKMTLGGHDDYVREIHVGLDAWDLKPVHLSKLETLIKEAEQ